MSAADLEVWSQGVTAPNLLRKRVRKEKQCLKGWKKVCSTCSETRGRVYPYTQTTQGVGHTTVAAETLKVATKTLVREKRSPLPRGVIPREHPQEERRSCQKVKAAREILSLLGSTTLTSQRPECLVTSRHMTEAKTQKITYRFSISLPRRNDGQCQHGVTCSIPHLLEMPEQKDGESTKEFVRRDKLECRDVKGAPECMKIFGFMHRITNPELIKRLYDKILKSVDEMMRVTTAFLRGEVAASNCERKKPFSSWKQQEANQKQNFKKGDYQNQQKVRKEAGS
ncbi:hypothetical protein Tco_0282691, partial [Tanacetum coccineum]